MHAGPVHTPQRNDRKTTYEIVVRGAIAADVAKDLAVRCAESSEGKTIIAVDVLDQSHLHGILDRLGDLNIEIESVNPV